MTGDVEGVVRIRLLGGFRVSVGGRFIAEGEWRLRKSKALVKLLALAPGHRLQRDQVLDYLWPGLDPAAAGGQLRKVVHEARRVGQVQPRYTTHLDLTPVTERGVTAPAVVKPLDIANDIAPGL